MRTLSPIVPHLSIDELYKKYLQCEDACVKIHWLVIWLRARGKGTTTVADVTGYNRDWVRRLVRRYNTQGPSGLEDRRANNGKKPLLSEELQQELLHALMGPAPDGGLWNSPKVAAWIGEHVGHGVPDKRGWIYLRHLGLTPQRPRPRHVQADPVQQEAFKKNCASTF